jgi:hypothetical protein
MPDENAGIGTDMKRDVKIACAVFIPFFSFFLLPKLIPWVAANPFYFSYVLSLLIVVPALVIGLAVGLCGLALVCWCGLSSRAVYPKLTTYSAAGLTICAVTITLAQFVPSQLPTGSYLLEFESQIWRDSESAESVENGFTPRQKMLGSLVESLDPEMTREELESLLGPSLETAYFEASNWDLIYLTGSERDSLFPLDSEWLLIWLDAAGRFDRFAIQTD